MAIIWLGNKVSVVFTSISPTVDPFTQIKSGQPLPKLGASGSVKRLLAMLARRVGPKARKSARVRARSTPTHLWNLQQPAGIGSLNPGGCCCQSYKMSKDCNKVASVALPMSDIIWEQRSGLLAKRSGLGGNAMKCIA